MIFPLPRLLEGFPGAVEGAQDLGCPEPEVRVGIGQRFLERRPGEFAQGPESAGGPLALPEALRAEPFETFLYGPLDASADDPRSGQRDGEQPDADNDPYAILHDPGGCEWPARTKNKDLRRSCRNPWTSIVRSAGPHPVRATRVRAGGKPVQCL